MRHGIFQLTGNDVAVLVDIAQAVRLIKNHQIPVNGLNILRFDLRKLVRANDRT